MNYKIQPTPAVALGAYEITPLEAAGAYTVFANGGDYVKPTFLRLVRSQRRQGGLQEQARPQAGARSAGRLPHDESDGGGAAHAGRRPACAPATTSIFPRPARPARRTTAGLPATPPNCSASSGSGFDDNRELDLEGAHSAAPDLGGVHEAGVADPRLSRHEVLHRARRYRLDRYRPAIGHAATPNCPDPSLRGLYLRNAAGGAPARYMAAAGR